MYSTLDLMHVWINYIIEKSVIYASNDPPRRCQPVWTRVVHLARKQVVTPTQ